MRRGSPSRPVRHHLWLGYGFFPRQHDKGMVSVDREG